MFKTRYQRIIKMLHWLRVREWFDEKISEHEVEILLSREVKRKLLRAFEKDDIANMFYWPREVQVFWDMFQAAKEYIDETIKTEKNINKNLTECAEKNNRLKEKLKKLEMDLPSRIDRIRGGIPL